MYIKIIDTIRWQAIFKLSQGEYVSPEAVEGAVGVLQCVSVLQCVAVCCCRASISLLKLLRALQVCVRLAVCCSVLQCVVVVYCSVLWQGEYVSPEAVGGAVGVLRYVAVWCSAL